jgi:hypothetical protein
MSPRFGRLLVLSLGAAPRAQIHGFPFPVLFAAGNGEVEEVNYLGVAGE